jgi:transposase InsO family protein
MKVSERFACGVTGQNRTTQRRDPTATTVGHPDAELRRWLRQTPKTVRGAGSAQLGLLFIPPGEPWSNGYVESFNGRVRDECLNINIFWSLTQARLVISDWKEDYNQRRRHSCLGYQAPAVYAAACSHRADSLS